MKYSIGDIVQTTSSVEAYPRRVGRVAQVDIAGSTEPYRIRFLDGNSYWYYESELRPYKKKSERLKVCKCCGGDIKIRNPKGYCDHLYYPENCDGKCKKVEGSERKKNSVLCEGGCELKNWHQVSNDSAGEKVEKSECKHEWRFLRIENKFKVGDITKGVEVVSSGDMFYCIFNPAHRTVSDGQGGVQYVLRK